MGRPRRAVALALPGMEPAPDLRAAGSRLRRSGKGPAPAPQPWEAVVLAVDTARFSGWSAWARGNLVARGELDTLNAQAIRDVVQQVVSGAAQLKLPAVIVLEKPWGKRADIVAALGQARERWLVQWRELAIGHRARVVLVMPATWRAAVLGGSFAGAPREEARAAEQAYARQLLGVDAIGQDEAPAVCIGHWASLAGKVGEVLSKTSQRASLQAWTKGA